MKVSQLGEFKLIDRLSDVIKENRDAFAPAWQNLITGIGDDAAAWKSESNPALATMDCLVQDVHFTLDTTGWRDLGWKSMAANLSDIAAMGGSPRYALVTLGLPDDSRVEDIMLLYEGMAALADKHGVAIVGGDTSSAPVVFISIAVFGQAGKHILTRGEAKAGDAIAVTGNLGGAAGGLRLLMEHARASQANSPLLEAFLVPCPRLEVGELLVAEGVRCAIDISDGLAADLEHICRRSGVGAVIKTARVPIHPALSSFFGPEALQMALGGGEDYELIFTGPVKTIEKIMTVLPCPVTIIGVITTQNPGKVTFLNPGGKPYSLDSQGWQHFAPNNS